jgi:hypothetical protein
VPRAVLTIASGSTGAVALPRSFFGLSTEYWGLPLFEEHPKLFDRVLRLLRVPGDGPMLLRVGGDSADHTFWAPRLRRAPRWMFRLTPRWLQQTSGVVHRLGVKLLLDLNLVTDSPARAAQLAQIAEADEPRGSIVGFEIGNEPDLYSRRYWLKALTPTLTSEKLLPRALTATAYVADFRSYARLLSTVAPRVTLAGPALALPRASLRWLSDLLAGAGGSLGMVTAHSYPYSACEHHPTNSSYPTIARLLSERASAGVAQSVEPAVRLAHRAGLKLRLDELNSVTCSGRRGISNTFATALWAPDTLFELLRARVDGVNMHVRATAINAPFLLTPSGLYVRPLMYGLALFTRALGPGAQLLPADLAAPSSPHLKAWAVRVRGNVLHVVLIDKGDSPATVLLRVPGRGAAIVERLLAPAVSSSSGVTLNGQHLGADARWHGAPHPQRVARTRSGYEVTVAGSSAALVIIRLRVRAASYRHR